MPTNETAIFSPAWLKKMDERARACKYETGSPEINTGFYAVKKTAAGWRVSNGRAWWDNPVLIREIHEYADGTVCAHNYIEGVGTFGRRHITEAGLCAVRASELTSMFNLARIVYFDHRKLDAQGRATRLVKEVSQKPEGSGRS